MGSSPADRPLVSIVITVKNEERHLARLLDSLVGQEPPIEVVLVDALSHDRTFSIAESYSAAHPGLLRAVRKFGSRGIGRNQGVAIARGDLLAFIDGDCFADSRWVQFLREGFARGDVLAGRTVAVGRSTYANLERVELFLKGSDVTYPSCNLAYRRTLFERLKGFDPRFITAEDIDLNLRAVQLGAHLVYLPEAVVYHHHRLTLFRFFIQAFWNGYGRKQLTEKHGSLWGSYRIRRLLSGQRTVLAWIRLVAAFSGYVSRVIVGGDRRLSPVGPLAAAGDERPAGTG
ncbi:MAG: glycosyltransferase [Thermoplasmata archaeon]|nr:glycosyltransferase [Thermoplasmata archaeon]